MAISRNILRYNHHYDKEVFMINSISYSYPQASLTTHAASNQAQIQPIENKADKNSNSAVVNTQKLSVNSIQSDIKPSPWGGLMELGILALGGEKQIEAWRSQGMEVSDKTILAAAKAFQEGAKQSLDKTPNTHGLSINRHQIVLNNQDTPAWFTEEYSLEIAMMENGNVKKSFQQGDEYHITMLDTYTAKAINAYKNI